MTEPATPWRFPWGLFLTIALLAGVVTVTFAVVPERRAAPTEAILAAAVSAVAVFVTMRRLQNYFWGVVAALGLVMHPLYWQGEPQWPRALRAEAVELVILAAVVTASDKMYQTRWAWRWWLALGTLCTAAGAVAWQTAPAAGWTTALLLMGALPIVGAYAWRQRRRQDGVRPCPGNVTGGAALALLAPVAGLLLGCLPEPGGAGRSEWANALELLQWPLPRSEERLRLFDHRAVQQWCWPTPWAVVPLMLWGAWCTLRRGQHELSRRQAPKSWALTWFGLITLATTSLGHDNAASLLLPLASLAVLLAVFGVADVLRSIWDQLRLAPPDERGE
jgi:hypothetical protein